MIAPREPGRREVWLAVTFVAALFAYEAWTLHLPVREYVQESGSRHGMLGVAARTTGLIAIAIAQAAFIWASCVSPRRWQVGYLAFFAVATLVEHGYVHATGTVTTANDIIVALQHRDLWSAATVEYFDWRALVPVAAYAVILGASRRAGQWHGRRLLAVLVLTWLVHSSYAAAGYLRRDPEVGLARMSPPAVGAQSFARSVTFLGWTQVETWFRYQVRQDVGYRTAAIPSHHVVLVVDESVRADHLSVNGYGRPTTPWLAALKQAHRLDSWGVAAAATSASFTSAACLLTGVNVLPDRESRMRSRPLIFQYARSLNYRTHLLGGTDQLERLGRSSRDFRYVDDYRRLTAFGDNPDTDFRIAKVVSDLLDEPLGQFIVVFKRGNHFPYRINYPSPGDVWPPADKGAGPEAEPPAFADTYDRGLRYNLDTFFRILLRPDGSRARTVILYTSDHGEGLGYNGTGWRAFGWETFAVPLLMLGDDRPVVDTRYRASHHNIFATLLDLMGFPSDRRPSGYGRSLLQARLQDIDRRPVFRGDLWGDDAFQTQDFDTMRPADMARRNQ